MPDNLSLSTGVSLGLLAGIVSGVCYLFANGLAWPKNEKEAQRRCMVPVLDDGVCRSCGGDARGGLIPCICHHHHQPVKFESGAWFLRQVQRVITLMPWTVSTDKLEQIEEECEGRESPGPSDAHGGELRNVREFLEALSVKLAGGPLEGTRVAPLYDHPAYLPQRNASLSSTSSGHPSSGASGAHAQLKRLVARVVEEASALPALARYAAEPTTPTIESSTYEDLLATAILNKVIERYQAETGSGGRSSGIHSASASPTHSEQSSPRSLNSRHARDLTPPLQEEDDVSDWEEGEATVSDDALELPRRVPFPEFGGDIVHLVENEDRDFDEVSGSDIQAVDGTWEENWLFQKKKIKTMQSVPVPMLVPNSNADYRALIGDRDAEDTTDLSDNASDSDEQEYKSDIKRVLDSKHVIGGKPKIDELLDYEPDSLTVVDVTGVHVANGNHETVIDAVNNEHNENLQHNRSDAHITDIMENGTDSIMIVGIDSGPLPQTEFTLKEDIHRTLLNGNIEEYAADLDAKLNGEADKDVGDSFSINTGATNTLSRHEREGEYIETVTHPIQRYADSLRRKHFDDKPQEIPTRDTDEEDDLIPGTIAYRERKKWLKCVDMPNNPYSPEAIQKRLSAKSTSSLFDTMTTKNLDLEDDRSIKSEDVIDGKETLHEEHDKPVKEVNHKTTLQLNVDNIVMNGTRSKSPSPRILKDVLAEEVPQYKRYGRDYYIRAAKASSGGRKKSTSDTSSISSMNKSTSLDNFDTEFASPGLLINQFNKIASNQQYNKFASKDEMPESITMISSNNKTKIMIEYEDVNEQTLFSAKPVYVDDDTDEKFEEILHSAYNITLPMNRETDYATNEPKSPNNLSMDNSYISSSSLEDSIKIYNVQTGQIVKSKADNVSPRYECAPDRNANIDIPDNNILGDTVDGLSQNGEATEESLVIVDSLDSFSEDKFDRISEIEEILPQLPKVKELAKKFVSMENLNEPVKQYQPIRRRRSKENILNETKMEKPKPVYMHSLTARSISKQFREELKLSMATPLKVPGGSKEIPEGEEVTRESSRPGSPVPEPGTLKTKLAFFESLKAKFNGK